MPFALAFMDLTPPASTTPAPSTATTTTIEKPKDGLVIAGAITLGATYLVTAGFSQLTSLGMTGHKSESQQSYYGWMLLPVIGPWISLGYAKGSNAAGMTLVAITSGTLQTIGAALITLGLTWKTKTVVPTTLSRVELVPLPEGAGLAIRAIGL